MRGARRPPVDVGPGERVLAWAATDDATDPGGVVAGTRLALYLPSSSGETVRVPWEQVQAADWSAGDAVLTVSEVGSWGEDRPEHRVGLVDAGRLLQLVRERVTASVVWQRHVPVTGRRGLRVIARRPPTATGEVRWIYEYDEGVDPDDPLVRQAAGEALSEARAELGV